MNQGWDRLKEYLIPDLQNDVIHLTSNKMWFYDFAKDFKYLVTHPNQKYYIEHMHTTGRYNITTNGDKSKQWVLDKKKELYNGVNCDEYSFLFKDYEHDVAIVCNKTDSKFTLVVENSKPLIPSLFNKGEFPASGWYLKEKWVTMDRLIEIIEKLNEKVAPMYKSKKVMNVNDKLGIFEHIETYEGWKSSKKMIDVNDITGILSNDGENEISTTIQKFMSWYAGSKWYKEDADLKCNMTVDGESLEDFNNEEVFKIIQNLYLHRKDSIVVSYEQKHQGGMFGAYELDFEYDNKVYSLTSLNKPFDK